MIKNRAAKSAYCFAARVFYIKPKGPCLPNKSRLLHRTTAFGHANRPRDLNPERNSFTARPEKAAPFQFKKMVRVLFRRPGMERFGYSAAPTIGAPRVEGLIFMGYRGGFLRVYGLGRYGG